MTAILRYWAFHPTAHHRSTRCNGHQSIWALAALWGVPANIGYITKKKKNQCFWELFKTSMINVVDILTACNQGKCLDSKFPKLSCFLSLRMSNDSSVPFLPAGFCLTGPFAIPVQGAFVLKSPARTSGLLVGFQESR